MVLETCFWACLVDGWRDFTTLAVHFRADAHHTGTQIPLMLCVVSENSFAFEIYAQQLPGWSKRTLSYRFDTVQISLSLTT